MDPTACWPPRSTTTTTTTTTSWASPVSGLLAARPAYATSVETSVYVHVDALGQRIGTRLYTALFAALTEEQVHRAYAQVTLPNPASVALHRRFGFHEIGLQSEVGYKFGRYWSVQLFEKYVD